MAETLHYDTPGSPRSTTLPRLGGALAMAGTFIGVGIFVLGCFGFSAAFYFSPIPLALGSTGLVLALAGLFYSNVAVEDSHVVAALLVNAAVIVGGLLELMMLLNKPFFAGQGGI